MIKQCPYCGSDYGLFTKEYVKYDIFYTFDGEPDGGSDMRPIGTSLKRKTTPLYCLNCCKKVTTLERLQQEIKQNE